MKRIVSPEDYPHMAEMYAQGHGYGAIGKAFGVSGTTASRLIRRYQAGWVSGMSRNKEGGHMSHGTTWDQHLRDVAEVRAYLDAHPRATVFDVALELHYTHEAARRIMKEAVR